jgi:23S rRNA (adenine2030-N6)-methyltransferase
MNYRHAFHAGSFADVVKHAVLARIIRYLQEKPAAFRAIDTHAGAGIYDLGGEASSRTGEWRDGIARVFAAALPASVEPLLRPYLDVVARFNGDGKLATYPGSPALVEALLRPQDRLVACELEPAEARALERSLTSKAAKAVAIDGWVALGAYVPPPERRGIVLIDPPYEDKNEFVRLADHLAAAHRKWPSGIYVAWYPIKDRAGPDLLAARLKRSSVAKTLRAEILVALPTDPEQLNGSGLIIINPPWTLDGELAAALPVLAKLLARDGSAHARARIDWLAGEG